MSGAFERLGRTLRLGVIGGGPGGMIGPMHRNAARLDGRFVIVAGVPSSDPARAAAAGAAIGLPEGRSYGTVSAMIDAERARADGIEAVAIMSPNDAHYPAALAAIEAGLDVICDKPMTNTLADARDLAARVRASGRVFCLTHAYAAYPMVRQARAMVAAGAIGAVRAVQVEYLHAGMATRVEDGPMTPKLRWKLDPARGGPSLVLGDIGTHAHHLACFVAGLPLARLAADLGALVPGRTIDDTAALLLRFEGGARGTLFVEPGDGGQREQPQPPRLGRERAARMGADRSELSAFRPARPSDAALSRAAMPICCRPRSASCASRAAIPRGCWRRSPISTATPRRRSPHASPARRADPLALDFPTAEDGVRGVAFVEAAVRSGRDGGAWASCEIA